MNNEDLDILLRSDPIAEAGKITGKSYKETFSHKVGEKPHEMNETSALGFLIMQQTNHLKKFRM